MSACGGSSSSALTHITSWFHGRKREREREREREMNETQSKFQAKFWRSWTKSVLHTMFFTVEERAHTHTHTHARASLIRLPRVIGICQKFMNCFRCRRRRYQPYCNGAFLSFWVFLSGSELLYLNYALSFLPLPPSPLLALSRFIFPSVIPNCWHCFIGNVLFD